MGRAFDSLQQQQRQRGQAGARRWGRTDGDLAAPLVVVKLQAHDELHQHVLQVLDQEGPPPVGAGTTQGRAQSRVLSARPRAPSPNQQASTDGLPLPCKQAQRPPKEAWRARNGAGRKQGRHLRPATGTPASRQGPMGRSWTDRGRGGRGTCGFTRVAHRIMVWNHLM